MKYIFVAILFLNSLPNLCLANFEELSAKYKIRGRVNQVNYDVTLTEYSSHWVIENADSIPLDVYSSVCEWIKSKNTNIENKQIFFKLTIKDNTNWRIFFQTTLAKKYKGLDFSISNKTAVRIVNEEFKKNSLFINLSRELNKKFIVKRLKLVGNEGSISYKNKKLVVRGFGVRILIELDGI